MTMTLADAIASAKKALDQGDKMGGGPNWTGGGFRAEAIRTLLAQYQDTRCQHTETQTDIKQAERTTCVHCGRDVRVVWIDRAGPLGSPSPAPDVSKLVEALKPFADEAKVYDEIPGVVVTHDNVELWQRGNHRTTLSVSDLRRAREAIAAFDTQPGQEGK